MGRPLVLLEQHLVGEFEGGEATDAGADNAGGAVAVGVLDRIFQFRLQHGFMRRAAGILGEFVSQEQLLALQALAGIEVRHLAGDRDVEVLGREALDLADAAIAALHRGPELVHACTQRSDNALASDHDAPATVRVCHVVLSRNSKPSRRPGTARAEWLVQAAAPEAFESPMIPFTRSTTEPTVANASTSSFVL